MKIIQDLGMLYSTKKSKQKKHFFLVECPTCKKEIKKSQQQLKREKECKSCASTTHGYSNHPLKAIYYAMLSRCNNPKNSAYKHYGARGIFVCKEWNNLKSFVEWALLNGYKKDLTIERKNNNKEYSPSNCIWTPMSEQCINKRNNINFTEDEMSEMIECYETLKPKPGTIKKGTNFRDNFCKKNGITVSAFSNIRSGNFQIRNGYVYQKAKKKK